ncbi:MAG: hypothetical protein WCA46_13590, partial [Actinocatenispora sp.]
MSRRDVLSGSERERLAWLGAGPGVISVLAAWWAEDPARHLVGLVGRVTGTGVVVSTATGLRDADWDVDDLPAAGDWVLLRERPDLPPVAVRRVTDDDMPDGEDVDGDPYDDGVGSERSGTDLRSGLGDDVPEDLADVADRCRFADCGHDVEPGCAVQAALHDGLVTPAQVAEFRRQRRTSE